MSNKNSIDFSMLLASSVHDIKNSLNTLMQSIDQIVDDLPADKKHKLYSAQYETSRINNDLIQLLGFYRLKENRIPLNIDEYCIYDLIEEQIDKNRPLAVAKNIDITFQGGCNLLWFCDEYLIGSLINNILVNAIRYARSQIEISISEVNGTLSISINDDGQGFPAHMLVDPLTQLASDQEHANSTCLGLYFAAQIAQLHQRKIPQGTEHGEVTLANGGHLTGGLFTLKLP
jgi:signal transduction histidine kinase